MQKITQQYIRNIAIIAHVDHGKTTLIDAILKQSHIFRQNQQEMFQERILDSNELEQEKGITIQAKTIAVPYNHYKINIIDTPGHADFSGEVERTLNMADGALLIVDAQEGVMTQTEFVLKKAFEANLNIIVVINKIDKKFADPKRTATEIEDLFLQHAKTEDQLDYTIFYAIARDGKIFTSIPQDIEAGHSTTELLLKTIISKIPPPAGDPTQPPTLQVASITHDNHLGKVVTGRVYSGQIQIGDKLSIKSMKDRDVWTETTGTVSKIQTNNGIKQIDIDKAVTGDIVSIAGFNTTSIGATMTTEDNTKLIPNIQLTPPTVKIRLGPNTSPFAGQEGEFVAPKQLEQRLNQEKERNISLEIEPAGSGSFFISGRGELQLAILMETIRREGYEFEVSKPQVILQKKGGQLYEPLEELIITAPDSYIGLITESISKRSGKLLDMKQLSNETTKFKYDITTRNLIGLQYIIKSNTKGTATFNSYIKTYIPLEKKANLQQQGALISTTTGSAAAYALNTIQERGKLFISPSTKVYEGMVIGINNRSDDIEVNPCKERHKTSVRMSHAEVTQIILKAPIRLTLDNALSFIKDDEILEVTPTNIRLRKKILKKALRVKERRLDRKQQ